MQLKFEQQIRIEDARKALEANGLSDAEIQEFGQENKLLIRVKASTTIEEKTAEKVVAIFSKEFPGNKFVVESSTEIGPTIGKKLQSDALVFTSFEPIADLTHGASSVQLPAHLSPHEGAQAQDAGHASAVIANLVDPHAPSVHHYDLLL